MKTVLKDKLLRRDDDYHEDFLLWDMMLRYWVNSCYRVEDIFTFRKSGIGRPLMVLSYPRRTEVSTTPLQIPQNSQRIHYLCFV
jgi:hypothetical protein